MLRLLKLSILIFPVGVCTSQAQVNHADIRRHLQLGHYDSAAYVFSQTAMSFASAKQSDSAIHYTHRILRLKSRLRNQALIPWAQNTLASAHRYAGATDSALYYYDRSLEHYRATHDTLQILTVISNKATVLKENGLYPEAIELCVESLLLTKHASPSRQLGSFYNTMASCYRESEEYSLAFQYFRQALSIRKALNLSTPIAQSYNNIGEAHLDVRQYDSALFYLFKALQLKKLESDKNSWTPTLDLIGRVHFALKEYDSADWYFKEALAINSDKGAINDVLNSMAELKLETNDFTMARAYLDSAETLGIDSKYWERLATTLELKLQLERRQNNLKAALAVVDRMKVLNDTLFNVERRRAILGAEPRYQSERKQQQIVALEETANALQAEIESKETFIRYFAVALILVLIIIVLAITNIITVRKNKKRVETLLSELHHRVKNNLQILSSLLMLQSQELTDEKAKQAVKTSESRVNAMALIHKKLYSDTQNQEINFREYITELVTYLVQTYGYTQKELDLKLDIDELNIDVDKAIPLGLIINELVSNAFKHAYEGIDNPELKILLNLRQQKELALSISDNGRSAEQPLAASDSFGLKMVRLLTKELRGKLEVTHQNGTGFHLQIPYSR